MQLPANDSLESVYSGLSYTVFRFKKVLKSLVEYSLEGKAVFIFHA